jgi:hypothetical protein
MKNNELKIYIRKNLFWFGVINLLVGLKLILSYIFPGLKTPGELMLSGLLLIIYAIKIWLIRLKLDKEENK